MRRPHLRTRTRLFPFVVAALLVVAGCATTTTRPPEIDPARVRAEQARQRELVLETTAAQQARLDRAAYPLLRAAAPLCARHVLPWPGFRALTVGDFPEEWRAAAGAVHRLGDSLQVLSMTPGGPAERAGLRPGDRLARAGDHVVVHGPGASGRWVQWLRDHLPRLDTLAVDVVRDGRERSVAIPLERVCAYEAVVIPSMQLNAFADGGSVYLTTAMMRFTEDDELTAIVAHEMAHNAMGHIEAQLRNASLGSLVGMVGDILTLAAGDTLPDETLSSYYGTVGATAHSRDFEREADYVGLYILALAGLDLQGAPRIFREFATAEPETIGYSTTHPTHAERFLLMEATIAEIEEKRRAGEPLRPERKDGAR